MADITGHATDYETYKEIMGELLSPIIAQGLDLDTLKRLYESKAVYLENLRLKCFWELNTKPSETFFKNEDYILILHAIKETRAHIRNLILVAVSDNLGKKKAS